MTVPPGCTDSSSASSVPFLLLSSQGYDVATHFQSRGWYFIHTSAPCPYIPPFGRQNSSGKVFPRNDGEPKRIVLYQYTPEAPTEWHCYDSSLVHPIRHNRGNDCRIRTLSWRTERSRYLQESSPRIAPLTGGLHYLPLQVQRVQGH